MQTGTVESPDVVGTGMPQIAQKRAGLRWGNVLGQLHCARVCPGFRVAQARWLRYLVGNRPPDVAQWWRRR
jgi:hypothetical protein